VLTTNAVTIAWSFAALAVTVVYPYTKRFLSMPQAVLGVRSASASRWRSPR
jgi:4-hydroxybenzoate polyprenyltransferase